MKKIISVILALLMLSLALVSCGPDAADTNADDADNADVVDNADDKGANEEELEDLIIGITYFEPMNYFDENGKLVGFETEFATEVCKKLGYNPVFQEIDWGSKEIELNSKAIDCIWNGMTITEERKANMSISNPYMKNEQVIITKKDVAANFTTAGSLKDMIVVAEAGSAGEELVNGDAFFAGADYTAVDTMAKAIMEVAAGTADACVVDYITALGMIGAGTDYENLAKVEGIEFAKEEYGIAFRKDSELTEKVNEVIAELYNDGTIQRIAEWYSLETQVIAQ